MTPSLVSMTASTVSPPGNSYCILYEPGGSMLERMSSSDASPRFPRCFWCLSTFSRLASWSAMTMKRVVDSLVFVCSTRTSVNCLATRSRMSVASFWLSPNCARMFSNMRLVPSPSFVSNVLSNSCIRCLSNTIPCVSCGVLRAHTTYARSAKMATRRAMMSHSIERLYHATFLVYPVRYLHFHSQIRNFTLLSHGVYLCDVDRDNPYRHDRRNESARRFARADTARSTRCVYE